MYLDMRYNSVTYEIGQMGNYIRIPRTQGHRLGTSVQVRCLFAPLTWVIQQKQLQV